MNPRNWPAEAVHFRDLTDLAPYARNARTHTREQIDQIAASMREWGWTCPILVDESNTVIAGHARAVERASVLAKEAGAKRVVPLPVSVPSHCQLMEAAADKFAERLNAVTFSDGKIPVIQNVDVEVRSAAGEIKTVLVKQLHQPVKWVETILKIKSMGITDIIESGPGKVLTGLIKRIDKELNAVALTDKQSLETALAAY